MSSLLTVVHENMFYDKNMFYNEMNSVADQVGHEIS